MVLSRQYRVPTIRERSFQYVSKSARSGVRDRPIAGCFHVRLWLPPGRTKGKGNQHVLLASLAVLLDTDDSVGCLGGLVAHAASSRVMKYFFVVRKLSLEIMLYS